MLYNKPATTIDQQAALLAARGMDCRDAALVNRWLETVGYYRLSSYWLPFEQPPASNQTRSKRFRAGTRFEDVVEIYVFDRQLRLLVMEVIERIEIAVRARWTYRLSATYGSHAHLETTAFSSAWVHIQLLSALCTRTEQSREVFVEHYKSKYRAPFMPPIWAATELMSFGELSKWVSATKDPRIKAAVAKDLGLPNKEVLEGTLQLLAFIRNVCAHHGRLWNRRTVKRLPFIRKFQNDLSIGPDRQCDNLIYNALVVLIWLIRHQSADTTFPRRVRELVRTRTDGQWTAMGFPANWQTRPAWTAP